MNTDQKMRWGTVAAIATVGLGARYYFNGPMCRDRANLQDRVVVITGGNAGIGKPTVVALVDMGAHVVMACRDEKRATEAVKEIRALSGQYKVEYMNLDLADLNSVRRFGAEFRQKFDKLDILINNAGMMATPQSKTKQGFEMQIGVNHLGHFLLTNLLVDRLKKARGRVVNVSSRAHLRGTMDLKDLFYEKGRKYSPWGAYEQSKLANVLFSNELNRRMQGTGVTSNSLHPGVIKTELMRYSYNEFSWWQKSLYVLAQPALWLCFKDIQHGAQTSIYCAVSPKLQTVGGEYFSDCAVSKVNPLAKDEKLAKALWDESVRLVGLTAKDSELA